MPFQREGVAFGVAAEGRVLVADEMGLGKSVQAIALALSYAEEWPVLVLCPASLRYTWAHEIERWLPKLAPSEVAVVRSRTDVEAVRRIRVSFVVMTYSLFANRSAVVDAAARRGFQVCIVDESHYLRTRDSQRTKLILPILAQAKRLVLLSGTPALARPVELWPQVGALEPSLFGTYAAFTKKYCGAHRGRFGWDVSGCSNADELHGLLSTVMVRRLKADVLTQLPPKRRQLVAVEAANATASKTAVAALGDASKAIDDAAAVGYINGGGDAWALRGEKNRALLDAWQASGRAKVGGAASFVAELLEGSPTAKILVFAHHLAVLDGLATELARAKTRHIRIDGSTPASERQRLVDAFQRDASIRVALLSVTAAGQGLTLTAADAVVFAELHWTPGVLCQAEDRAHRIGQHQSVNVYFLVITDETLSVDMALWRAIGRKVAVVGRALNGDQRATLGAHDADRSVREQGGPSAAAASSEASQLASFFAENATRQMKIVKGDIRSFFCAGGPSKAASSNKTTSVTRASVASSASSTAPAAAASSSKHQQRQSTAGSSVGDALDLCDDNSGGDDEEAPTSSSPSSSSSSSSTSKKAPARPRLPRTRRSATAGSSPGDSVDLCGCEDVDGVVKWACPRCTLLNTAARCGACDAAKPPTPSSTKMAVSAAAVAAATAAATASDGAEEQHVEFVVSLNTGRVQVFSTEGEGASTTFNPKDVVEGGRVDQSRLASSVEDPRHRATTAKFLSEWLGLRAVERERLSNRRLRLPLARALAACAAAEEEEEEEEGTTANCFDRGVDRPSKKARKSGDEEAAKGGASRCDWCDAALSSTGTSETNFCSWRCACEFAIRRPNNSKAVRTRLFALEHGVCQACGLDGHGLYNKVKALAPPERFQVLLATKGFAPSARVTKQDRRLTDPVEGDFWQADHILPVAEGGGCCSLDNYRTLCVPCHAIETAALRQRLRTTADHRRAQGTPKISSFFAPRGS